MAMQLVALVHETLSSTSGDPLGSGLGSSDHEIPFQDSATGATAPA
jgi:hypothetical protein